jgi:hypothetical protein
MKNRKNVAVLAGVILCVAQSLFAQSPLRKYKVQDKASGNPLPFYSIKLVDNTQKTALATLTNNEGVFQVDTAAIKKYAGLVISITFLGSKKLEQPFSYTRDTIFQVQESAQALQEVMISAKKRLLSVSNNKIAYDLAKDSINSKSNVANALRQLPGVDVSLQGDVKVGDKKILYMLNGQEDALVGGGKGLNALPARYIKTLELITDPDPRFRERGYDLIINIISKSDLIEGYLGSFSADLNSRGAPGGNVRYFYRKNSFAVNIVSSLSTDKNSLTESTDVLTPGNRRLLTSGSAYTTRAYNNSLELNYSLKKALIFVYASYNLNRHTENRDNALFLNGVNTQNAHNLTTRTSNALNVGTGIRFNPLSKKTTGSILLSYSNTPTSNIISSDVRSLDSTNLAANKGLTSEAILQGTFATKLDNKFSFDYGVQGVYRNFSSDNTTTFIRSNASTIIYEANNDYSQDINALFFYVKVNPDKNLQYSIGARAEYSVLSSFVNSFDLFRKTYLNVMPRVNFSYKTSPSQTVEMSYRVNLKRPSYNYVSPFINSSNSLLNTVGNPDLKPELFHIVSASYSFYLPKNFYLRPELYTSFSNNSIQRIAAPSDGRFLYTYQNGGQSNTSVFYLGAGGPITKTVQFNLSGGVGQSYVKLNDVSFKNTFYTITLTNTYTFKKGFRAQFSGFFNSPIVQPQGYSTANNSYTVSMSKSFHNDKSTLNASVVNPFTGSRDFKNVINDSGYMLTSIQSTPVRFFTIGYFYRFGKLSERYVNRGSRTSTDDLKTQ